MWRWKRCTWRKDLGDGGDAVGIRDSGYEDALLGKAVLTAYYGVVRVVVLEVLSRG